MRPIFIMFLCGAFLAIACTEKNDATADVETTIDVDTVVTDEIIPDTATLDEDTLSPDEDTCNDAAIGDDFLAQIEGYDTYLSFRLIGMINEADVTTPVAFFQSKFNALLPDHPEVTLAQAVGFILEGEQGGEATIELNILADPGTMFYGSLTMAILSKDWLIAHKEQLMSDPVVDEAPLMQVMKIAAVSDTVVKKCIIAVNDGDPEQPGLPAPGKMMMTVCDNVDFSAEENVRIGINAKLTEDVDKILALLGLSDAAELCSCADAATNQPVDCPDEETPDADTVLTD